MNNTDFDFLGPAFSAERWAYAGRMTLLGMVAVFAVLALLWFILVVFRIIMEKSSAKNETAKQETVTDVAVAPESEVSEAQDDTELIAVLTAAIASYRDSEGDSEQSGAFRVVSFKRVHGKGSWNSCK